MTTQFVEPGKEPADVQLEGGTASTNVAGMGDPAYIEKMTKKAEAGTGVNVEPELLAGKYKTQEDLQKGVLEILSKKHGGDMVAAYKELEKTLGAAATPDGEEAEGEETSTDQNAQAASDGGDQPGGNGEGDAEEAGDTGDGAEGSLDYSKYQTELIENGKLSDESYKELTDHYKVSKVEIDTFLAGVKAQYADLVNRVGGQEAYESILIWAGNNLSEAEITKFDTTIHSGDMDAILDAVDGLQAKYIRANGVQPKRRIGGNNASAATGYSNYREMVAAQKDSRYWKDPAYRAEVQRKVAASKF